MNLVLDVSNNNPITLAQLRQSKAWALIAKATEGTNFDDKTLGAMRAIAKEAGVPFGSYLFLHANSVGNEAGDYLAYAKPRKGDIQPVIDAEVSDGESMAQVAARVQSCARALEHAGYKPILYTYSSFWKQLVAAEPTLKRLRIWQADYPGKFTRWFPGLAKLRMKLGIGASVVMWQWTDAYQVGGKGYDASRLFVDINTIRI